MVQPVSEGLNYSGYGRTSTVEWLLDLDEPAVRAAIRGDPSTFISGEPPVCIDEYQRVPTILDSLTSSPTFREGIPESDRWLTPLLLL